jgi:DNA-directed RNA polymerase sigma subunit (sigma70/sigma32)
MADDVQNLLNSLSSGQRDMITLRFDFNGQEHTLQEAGYSLGVTSERIRQIEDAVLWYLCHHLRTRLLRNYLD